MRHNRVHAKGGRLPDYKEVTITIVEGEKTARVWTNIRRWHSAFKRLGIKPDGNQALGCWYTCPAEWFWPRRKRRAPAGMADRLKRGKLPATGHPGASGKPPLAHP